MAYFSINSVILWVFSNIYDDLFMGLKELTLLIFVPREPVVETKNNVTFLV
jgi:hypothetical protein